MLAFFKDEFRNTLETKGVERMHYPACSEPEAQQFYEQHAAMRAEIFSSCQARPLAPDWYWLPVERVSDFLSKRFRCEGLVQKDNARFEDPVVDDGFIRVPRHVDHA